MASAQTLNSLFVSKLSTNEGKEKAAEFGGSYIRDRLREVSFVSKIIPEERVTRADCQVSTRHDTLVKIISVEPDSRAMQISFRGQPSARFFRGPRAECGFFTISSEIFQKTEQELLAYDIPITKIIEENSVKDLDEVRDREFLIHCEAAVQAMQKDANGGTVKALTKTTVAAGTTVEFSVRKGELARTAGTDDATVRPVQRKDIVEGFKMLDGKRGRCAIFVLTEPDFDDVMTWTVEDNGDRIQSETTVDGYKYNTLCGRSYVRTIKTDILRPGNIYFFAAPEFLGKHYILNETKFYIDKIANMITFQSWMDLGMALVNVAMVKKVELYSADASSLDTQGLLSNFIPVAEDALGTPNNKVDLGLKFPQVLAS